MMHLRQVTFESYPFRMLLHAPIIAGDKLAILCTIGRVPCSILSLQDGHRWLRVFVVFSSFQANAATLSQKYATTAFLHTFTHS